MALSQPTLIDILYHLLHIQPLLPLITSYNLRQPVTKLRGITHRTLRYGGGAFFNGSVPTQLQFTACYLLHILLLLPLIILNKTIATKTGRNPPIPRLHVITKRTPDYHGGAG